MMTFSEPTRITARYRIVTPMFLGGDGHHVDDQHFRNASFKGALRFWWRALNWGRMLKDANGNTDAALTNLHAAEGRLFGKASDGEEGSRQSLIRVSSKFDNKVVIIPHSPQDDSLKNVAYLLGLGLHSNNDKGSAGHKGVQRDYIKAGAQVEVQLQFPFDADDESIRQVRQAAIALGLFGGLGSRARKGFGSLAIHSITDGKGNADECKNLDDIKKFIQDINFSSPEDVPLTAFTKATRIDASEKGRDAMRVLTTVCQQLHAYRDGTVGQSGRLNNFAKDRELARNAQEGQTIAELPSRAIFGLPHNYQWKEPGNPKLDIAPADTERNRRASPLLIHIHEFPDNSVVAIQTLLPTTFLPEGTNIALKSSKEENSTTMTVPNMNYQHIHNYLNDHFPSKEILRRG